MGGRRESARDRFSTISGVREGILWVRRHRPSNRGAHRFRQSEKFGSGTQRVQVASQKTWKPIPGEESYSYALAA